MDEILDEKFIGSLVEFARTEKGAEILKLSRQRTRTLDNLVEIDKFRRGYGCAIGY
jgi:hypothetical protein